MTEPIRIHNIEKYTQKIINGTLVLTPKKDYIDYKNIKDMNDYKNVNHNGMNLFDVLTDLSQATGVDMFNCMQCKTKMEGLLHGIPKHDNLYYMISVVFNKSVPKWFALKYTGIEEGKWSDVIEK